MSKGRFTSRHEAAIKQIRAKAHKEQTTFRNAVGEFEFGDIKRYGLFKPCCPICAAIGLETPRVHSNARKHARRYNAKDDALDTSNGGCDVCDGVATSPSRIDEPITVSLNDVKTKRAKAKGVRKEYEVIQSASQRVIVLDDFEDSSSSDNNNNDDDDDDWEQVDRVPAVSRRNYATVVKGS